MGCWLHLPQFSMTVISVSICNYSCYKIHIYLFFNSFKGLYKKTVCKIVNLKDYCYLVTKELAVTVVLARRNRICALAAAQQQSEMWVFNLQLASNVIVYCCSWKLKVLVLLAYLRPTHWGSPYAVRSYFHIITPQLHTMRWSFLVYPVYTSTVIAC